jgi:glycosyltransferase involved in cell wall biosynthesis
MQPNSMIEISVTTPVYNGMDFVQRCYANLCIQSYQQWEWVVVDDGSTDGTAAQLQELAAYDSRVRVISYQPNRGRGHARTVALQQARGEWAVIWDIDDLHFPERLTRVLSAKRAGYDYCCAYAVVVDNDLQIKTVRGFGDRAGLFGRGFVHPTLACRKDILAGISYTVTQGVGGIGEDVKVCWMLPLKYRGQYYEEALTIYQEDREVHLRKAIDSNLAQLALLRQLRATGLFSGGRGYRSVLLKYVVKIGILYCCFIHKDLYRKTTTWRSSGQVTGGRVLSDEQQEFIKSYRTSQAR